MPESILSAVLHAPIVTSLIPSNIIRHPEVVERDSRPYWQQRGWVHVFFGRYSGWYRTAFGSWRGKARKDALGEVELFIHQPPDALAGHENWHCFFPRGDGWYFIHIQDGELNDLSSGIIRVEQILTEAHKK